MYKYNLDKSSKKFKCPKCSKKRFVLYVDTEIDDYVSDKVGRCDREVNCGYHFTPKMYSDANNLCFKNHYTSNRKQKEIVTSYHSNDELKLTADYFEKNNFVKYLYRIFNSDQVLSIINDYKIGTAPYWYYGTVFWQIDVGHKIRGGKIISYQENGKRTKYINWVHSFQIKQEMRNHFNLNQCLFGEHLVSGKNKILAIVESEKTACIMSQIFDKYIWLACGSLSGLSNKKLQVIKPYRIVLYPDLGIDKGSGTPYAKWNAQKEKLNTLGYKISISTLLEQKGTLEQKQKGFDIADYFMNQLKSKEIIIKSKTELVYKKLKEKHPKIDFLMQVFDVDKKNMKFNRCE